MAQTSSKQQNPPNKQAAKNHKFTNEVQGRKKITGFTTNEKLKEKFVTTSEKSRTKSFRTPVGNHGR